MQIDRRTEALILPTEMEIAAEEAEAVIREEQHKTALAKLEQKSDEATMKGARSWLA